MPTLGKSMSDLTRPPAGDARARLIPIARGCFAAIASLFLLMALLLWAFRVHSGRIMLASGSSRITADKLAFNHWFAGAWLLLSSLALLDLFLYRKRPLLISLLNLAIFLLLVLSTAFEDNLFSLYLSLTR